MNSLNRTVNLLGVAILMTILSCFIHQAQQPKEKFVDVVSQVMPSAVSITVYGTKGKQQGVIGGSGVYVSTNGYILTCAHLFNFFDKMESILIEDVNGDMVASTLVKASERYDLALLRTTFFKETPSSPLADPRKLRVGQEVFAIGSPLGLDFSVTSGIISALYRDVNESYNVTQSDTSINPGNSGGPLFNLKGEIIGINVFMVSPIRGAVFTGLGFSMQVSECIRFLVDCKKISKDLVL